jgi:hypothetical protein
VRKLERATQPAGSVCNFAHPCNGVSSSKLPVKGAMTMKESDSRFGSVHFILCCGAGCYAGGRVCWPLLLIIMHSLPR